MKYNKNEVIKGFIWSGLDKLGVVVLQLALELILARLLLPKDYGIVGAVLIFVSFAITLSEGGFSNALIQKKNRTELDYSTVFIFNLIVGVLIYFILFFSAPFIESFFRIEGLTIILRVITVGIIFNASIVVHKVRLSLLMDFKSQAKYSLISVLLSGIIGVFLAYKGFGEWALVFQSVSFAFFNALFLWLGYKWFPKMVFSFQSLKELFGFGSKILLSSIIQSIYFNSYPVLIGRVLPTKDLGIYSKTNQFTQMPASVLTNVIQRVLFPFFSSYQNDDEKIFSMNQLYTKICILLFFPLFFILALIAQPFILVFFSQKWAEMVNLFAILCITYSFYPLIVNNMMLFQVKNKPALFLKIEMITKITGVIILFVTIHKGIFTIGVGLFLQQILQFFITTVILQLVLRKNIFEQIKIFLPLFVFSILFFFVGRYFLSTLSISLLMKLIIGIIIGLLFYGSIYFTFFKKDILLIIDKIKKGT